MANFGFKKATEMTLKGDRVPTGSLFLDLVLGGGYLAGSIVELMGENQVGKSFLAMKTAEQVHRGVVLPSSNLILPEKVGWVDVESQLDKKWAARCGVDLERFYIEDEFTDMEDCLGAMIAACNTREFGLLVYDSIGASLPSTILAKKLQDTTVTSHLARAKLMSTAADAMLQALRNKGNDGFPFNPTVAIFLNHTQQNITNQYAPDESVGGRRIRFAASTRIFMWVSNAKEHRIQVDTGGDKPTSVGQVVMCDIYKQRGSGAKGVRCWFPMYRRSVNIDGVVHYAGEIDRVQEIADILSTTPVGELIGVRDGNYYTVGGKKRHGMGQLLEALRDLEPEERLQLEETILEKGTALY